MSISDINDLITQYEHLPYSNRMLDALEYSKTIVIFSLISAILTAIARITGIGYTAKEDYDYIAVKILIISFLIDILLSFIAAMITASYMSDLRISLTGSQITLIIFYIIAFIVLTVSLFLTDEKIQYITAASGIGLYFVILIIAIASAKPSGLELVYEIFYLIGLIGAIAMIIYMVASESTFSYRRRVHYSSGYASTSTFAVGAVVYNKNILINSLKEVVPANTRMTITGNNYNGTFNVSYIAGSEAKFIYNVGMSQLTKEKPMIEASAAPASKPKPEIDATQKLKELKQLFDDGIITEEEYQEKRKKYIEML